MKKLKGFTLIEMIIVVSIISIISGIAIPLTLSQIKKAEDKKFYIEAKIIESAINSYELDHSKKIKDGESIRDIKEKLTSRDKKYVNTWPSKIKCSHNGEEVEVTKENIDQYKVYNLLEYIKEKDLKYLE